MTCHIIRHKSYKLHVDDIKLFRMKLSYNKRTGRVTERSMSGNMWQSSKLKRGANVIVATPGQLVHYMKSKIIRNGSLQYNFIISDNNRFIFVYRFES